MYNARAKKRKSVTEQNIDSGFFLTAVAVYNVKIRRKRSIGEEWLLMRDWEKKEKFRIKLFLVYYQSRIQSFEHV